jgi:hypothetical protein
MITKYSLHKIDNSATFPFSADKYSRFKFGDGNVAEQFGNQLAQSFISNHNELFIKNPDLVVVSSPYAFIPTATFAMKNHFINHLNNWLFENGYSITSETKINRTVTYKIDYGNLTAEDRFNLIKNDQLHIDKDYIKNKTLLFLDDIRITGSHEKIILNMAERYQLNNEMYLIYFAELINKDIHPNIENFLNYFSVKSIFDLIPIIESDAFCINTRIVKYILSNNEVLFKKFIEPRALNFKREVYYMAIGNSYHTIDEYKKNIYILKEML